MIQLKNVSVVSTFAILISIFVFILVSSPTTALSFKQALQNKLHPSYTEEDLWCLAKNIFHEAGVESDLGKYAVAQVTLNRVEHTRWPSSICGVVMDPKQFSWTLDKKLTSSQPKGKNWDRSLAIAEDVLENGVKIKMLENALFYHAVYVNPFWSKKKERVAQIDRHIFYNCNC